MRWAGHVARRGIDHMHIGFGWGNMRERDHSVRPECRWENNIKIYLQEIGLMAGSGLNWAPDNEKWRDFVTTVMNFRAS
jgi:hypothetical protein